MATWMKLVAVAALATSALALPRPDEYKIPAVGNNRRSQYYVLHDDGSFKYGYDTGEDAFESQKTNDDGDVDGKFGYRDADGQEFRVQYTSGAGGFVAQGDHIPQVHPDVSAAFAAARARGPFVDPLADTDGDRSYNFDFDGEEHSRSEVSNSDGTVTGSYSYIDEFGRTRSYTYRAGKGIGFVIEGDDIPQPVQPLASHTTSTQFGAASHRGAAHQSSQRQTTGHAASTRHTGFSHGSANRASNVRASSSSSSSSKFSGSRRQPITPTQTYFAPSRTAHSQTTSVTRGSSAGTRHSVNTGSSFNAGHSAQSSFSAASRPATTRQSTFSSNSNRNFEAANTRSSQSPSGSYSVAYETSSHSRQESGDDDNNVRGRFQFRADDDGADRSISYEAGSATGFIAQGAHLPIGPIVPGAPTGQVTGRIVPVQEIPFVDPLADSDTDASYSFGFESDDYSRTETADEDGNVSGTYTVLGEDNILRTYRFRAGEGIGFETEEISARPGSRSSVSSTRSSSSASSAGHSSAAHRGSSVRGGASHGASSQRTTFSHGSSAAHHGASSGHRSVAPVATTYTAPQASAHSSRASAQSSSFSASTRHSGSVSGANRASFKSTQRNEVFPGFELRQYDASEGRGKYGYVLKFDD